MTRNPLIALTMFLLVSGLSAGGASAGRTLNPLEPVDVSSPRATMESFIQYNSQAASAYMAGNIKEAKVCVTRLLQCLNLDRELPDLKRAVGFESILYLVEILHRIQMPAYTDIPDRKAVQDQKLTSWTIPHTPITIGLVKDQSSAERFLFTPDTLKRLPELYNSVKQLPYLWGTEGMGAYKELTSHGGLFITRKFINLLPSCAMRHFWGLRLWQWIGLTLFILSGFLAIASTYVYGRKALEELDRKFNSSLKHSVGGLFLPIGLIFFSKAGLWFVIYGLHIFNADIYMPIALTLLFMFYIGWIWFVGALLNRLAAIVIFVGGFAKGGMDTQLIRLGFQIMALIIIGILAIDFGARLGLPTYSMVTGLGIGGLAVALAGREALSNLIGTIMIILDQPFKPGDYIELGNSEHGTVTEVGFRSTRIRTRDGVLISIPNSTVANMKIVNQSAPVTVSRVHVPVGVAYGSDPEEVEEALLTVAAKCEHVTSDPPPSVRFLGFGDSSLNFSLLCWIELPEFRGRAISKLNLAIYTEFQKRGIVMPFPQRDVHVVKN
ncbi:MAG: mechanosensitive ion channel family protein [Deltaproteobacteria bacterium]|nr:mechanosensitive ion channel family protein [Deltaproteobacteria bacterium]